MKSKFHHTRGFSLTEMLTVVGVIGVISAIAVPQVSKINSSAQQARDHRNAQNLVSVFKSAEVAGIDFYVEGDLSTTLVNVVNGGYANEGVFDGSFFGLPGLSEIDLKSASDFIIQEHGSLSYSKQSVASTNGPGVGFGGPSNNNIAGFGAQNGMVMAPAVPSVEVSLDFDP